jgi:hypothetical protein
MLTDDELATRLGTAFHESVPELEYAGAMPRVRHRGGLAATSVLAATAALALTPAALQHTDDRAPVALPSAGQSTHDQTGRTGIRTLTVAGLHLTYAATADQSALAFEVGDAVTLPPDAQKVDVDIPAEVWLVADPATGDPAMYVRADGTTPLYGVVAPGWTRQQLIDLLEHGDQR